MEQAIRQNLTMFGHSLIEHGLECYNFGQLHKSIQYLEKALFVHKQTGCRSGEAWSHCRLGRSLFIVCQYDKAVEHYQKALDIRGITGHERQRLEGRVYNNLGEVHQLRGNHDEACRYYKKALGISEEIKNEIEQAVSYNNLGVINHNCLGKLDEALAYHMKALEIRKRLRYRNAEGTSYNNIGGVYEARGQYEKALEYYKKSLAVSKEIKDRRLEGNNFYFIGKVYRVLGQNKKALEHQERALEIKSEIGEFKAGVVAELGILHMAHGDYEKALGHLNEAIK
ncbi:hypothetical protein OS493_016954 [Desmophyllum pertusum]|uniref:Uncharacterized protein n=1 Tax=Desmophyllum pertusum TaxID=174260 RepID=A0A9X0CK26_9CNID|nr:hypothetical protein OS493_016954 [Desmophyllum pertusum]